MQLDSERLRQIIKWKIKEIDNEHQLFGQWIDNAQYDREEGKISAYEEVLDCIKKLEELK